MSTEPKEVKVMCQSRFIDVTTKVIISDVRHAASVAHKCSLEQHAIEVLCKCECGYTYTRNIKY